MNNSERTKCVTLKHFFSFDDASVVEIYKVQKMCKQLLEVRSINCYAQKQFGSIAIFLEDGTLFHTVTNSAEYNMLNSILQKEKLLVGEVTGDLNFSTQHYFLIKLYYDYISGNHDPYDIIKLWMRDFEAKLLNISIPKAKYVGSGNKADALDKGSAYAHFIDDTDDIEIADNDYGRILDIIDPKHDHSMTEELNVAAIIPNWASQPGYYILSDYAPIWLAPSFNADIIDIAHQNHVTRGRVISYSDNYDGTYHFELKFHIKNSSAI